MKLVQFGAGNIGRSFIGQIFSLAGWEVVFVDIDKTIIEELNLRREYAVIIKDRVERTISVKNVRGVLSHDTQKVIDEVANAELLSTAVGKNALPRIANPIAKGLLKRGKKTPVLTLDIIICENIRNAAILFQEYLRKELPPSYPLQEQVGLVETSIGKMVPIRTQADRLNDPLLVYAEAYNTLIVDKLGFRGVIPDVHEIEPKDNMKAYVDRKLFIHNLGHAVLSYTAFVFKRSYRFVWEAAFDDEIIGVTKAAMWEAGMALIDEYPLEFNENTIGEHIDDLIRRFGNKALGDSIYRAGRDLYRKLDPNDRLLGAINLCVKHGRLQKNICFGVAAALYFKAVDDSGKMFDRDRAFHEMEMSRGLHHVLSNICKIHAKGVYSIIEKYYSLIERGEKNVHAVLGSV